MKSNNISVDIRSDIRFFAFWFGNGTLLPEDTDFDFDYEPCISQNHSIIGNVFYVYINNLRSSYSKLATYNPSQRAAQWLLNYCNPNYNVEYPFELWELADFKSPQDFFDAIKLFAFQVGNGFLEEDILHNVDYNTHLFEGGDFLESIFAVFTNILLIDAEGNAINADYARHRAAQFIRKYLDDTYQVVPPFEEWELELV